MAKTVTPRMSQTRWSAGTDQVARVDFDTDAANIESKTFIFIQGTLAGRPAAGTVGRLYTVVGDGTPANNGKQFYDNGSSWITPSKYIEGAVSVSTSTSTVPLTLQGFSGQVSNLFEVKDSSNALLAYVSPDGTLGVKENVLGGAGGSLVTTNTVAAKAVHVVKGAASQSTNLTEWRNSANSLLAYVTNSGGAVFGPVTATTINSSGLATLSSITTGAVAATGVAVVNSSGSAAQTINATTGPIYEYRANGTVVSRQTQAGMSATKRASVGDVDYNGTDTSRVTSLAAGEVALRVIGAASQSANLIQAQNSAGTAVFAVSPAGVLSSAGAGTFAGGLYTSTPSNLYGTAAAPTFEVSTGTGTGAFNDFAVLRHSGTGTAATRTIALAFKFSTEANQTESDKWSGIRAFTAEANSANVALELMTAGNRAVSIQANNDMNPYGDIVMQNAKKLRWTTGTSDSRLVLYESGVSLYETGVQAGTYYHRAAGNFYWYQNGAHSASAGDPGSGGTVLGRLMGGSDPRFITGRITIEDVIANDSSTPSFQIGSQSSTHFQMSNATLNVFTNSSNNTNGTMTIQNAAGGILNLGSASTDIRIGPATVSIGGKAFTISYSAPSSPADGDVWIDVDA